MYNKVVRNKRAIISGKSSGEKECDICKAKAFLEIHHINGREIPDAERLYNLCSICPNCHKAIHFGSIIIEKWASGFDGDILLWHKKGEESLSGEESSPNLF